MMKSEVFLQSQLAQMIDGLAAFVQHGPALAGNEAANFYYAGYLAALQAVAKSCGIAVSAGQPLPKMTGLLALETVWEEAPR